jgi:hypothetical protein
LDATTESEKEIQRKKEKEKKKKERKETYKERKKKKETPHIFLCYTIHLHPVAPGLARNPPSQGGGLQTKQKKETTRNQNQNQKTKTVMKKERRKNPQHRAPSATTH